MQAGEFGPLTLSIGLQHAPGLTRAPPPGIAQRPHGRLLPHTRDPCQLCMRQNALAMSGRLLYGRGQPGRADQALPWSKGQVLPSKVEEWQAVVGAWKNIVDTFNEGVTCAACTFRSSLGFLLLNHLLTRPFTQTHVQVR